MAWLIKVSAMTVMAFAVNAQTEQPKKATVVPLEQRVETEVVELGRFGFTPKEIRRPKAGKFFLYVRSNVGIKPLTLMLGEDSPSPKASQNLRLTERKFVVNEPMELSAGKYVLWVSENPEWRLTIESKGSGK